jgi:4-amino-4-deoxy-L-arabinose transferase-like glycosyltransferase
VSLGELIDPPSIRLDGGNPSASPLAAAAVDRESVGLRVLPTGLDTACASSGNYGNAENFLISGTMRTRPALNNFVRWLDARQTIHLVVALAMLVRLAALAFLAREPLAGDDTLYHDFAVRALSGSTIYPLVPPAVGYYLAFFYRIFGMSPLVARASILPLAAGFMYALYAVAVRFAGRKGANLLALVFAIYPLQVLCSVEPITELPAALFLVVALLLVLGICEEPRTKSFAALGLVLGLLILTRPSALPMLVFVPLYLIFRSRRWLRSALVAIIPILMIASYISIVYRSTGHLVMINFSSTQNLFLGNNAYSPVYRTWWFSTHDTNLPAGYEALNAEIMSRPWYGQNALYRQFALQSIAARPDLFAARTLSRMRVYFAFDSYSGSLLLNRYSASRVLAFAAIALDASLYVLIAASAILFLVTLTRASERFWPTVTVLFVLLLYAGPYFISVSHPIYHFPVVPLMGLLAAAGWSGILEGRIGWGGGILARRTRQIALACVMLLFAYIQVEYAVVMYLYSSH